MVSILTDRPAVSFPEIGRPPDSLKQESRVYAIAFDMDIEQLRIHYRDPYNNAYLEIRRVLQRHGFAWQQGSVYFGGDSVTAVTCGTIYVDANLAVLDLDLAILVSLR